MRVENVADHPDVVQVIARWHWDEWGHADPGGSLQSWTAGLARRMNRDRIPMTLVAFDDSGAPTGSVTLNAHDMPDRADLRHLTPWIAGTFVVPERRGNGVGTALMQHAAEEARRLGVQRVYLYTSDARGFYEKLGWAPIQDDFYESESVTIMSLSLS
jgi:GNAT superfamily N-acetyltransferase